jgi:hypothetical protein
MYYSVELYSYITTSIPVDSELVPAERLLQLAVGCPAKRIFFLSVRTETNRNTDSFGSVSVFFPKEYNHLFRFVSVCFGISKPFINEPKVQKLM